MLKLYRHPNSPNWYIRGAYLGQTLSESTRTADPKVAREILRAKTQEIERQIVAARQRAASGVNPLQLITVAEAIDAYVARGGSARFLSPIRALLGWRVMASIRNQDLSDLAQRLYPQASPATINRQVYTPLIAVYNLVADDADLPRRVWRRPQQPRGTMGAPTLRAGTTPIDYDTAARFLAALNGHAGIALLLLFYTGLRPIELVSLGPDDVNPAERWGVVRTSKTGAPRGFPVHSLLVPVFEALVGFARHLGHDRLVLTQRAVPYTLSGEGAFFASAIRTAQRRTGLNHISAYTARHTVATELVRRGVHPYTVGQILGHAGATTTARHYVTIPQADQIAGIDLLPVPEALANLWFVKKPLKPWVAGNNLLATKVFSKRR